MRETPTKMGSMFNTLTYYSSRRIIDSSAKPGVLFLCVPSDVG